MVEGAMAGLRAGRDLDAADARRLNAIIDAAPEAIVLVGADRRISWYSGTATRSLGWQPEVMVGTDVRDFVAECDRETFDRAWGALLEGEKLPGHYEMMVLDAEGAPVLLDTTVMNLLEHPDVHAVVFTCRDTRSEQDARDQLSAVVGSLQEGLLVLDHRGLVVDASPAALSLFGLRPNDDMRGRSLRLLLADRVRDERGALVGDDLLFQQAIDDGTEVTGVMRGYDHPDGRNRWLSISTRVLQDQDRTGVAISIVDVTDRYDTEQELRDQVRHDPLTGLPNRLVLAERLQEVLDERSSGVAVLFLDLDGFKAVNDLHGHQAGDAVLRHAARRLQSAVRPGDLVVRYGGDEFVVVCSRCESADDALAVTDRVRANVSSACTFAEGEVTVQASVGIAWVDSKRNGIDGSAVLQAADLALYRVKQDDPGGRDLVVIRF